MNKIIESNSNKINSSIATTLAVAVIGYGSYGYIYACDKTSKCNPQEHIHTEQYHYISIPGSQVGNSTGGVSGFNGVM